MNALILQLPILPIILPLLTGALMLLVRDSWRRTRIVLPLLSLLLQVASALALLAMANGALPAYWPHGIAVYELGAWKAPFGIVLVADRLSAVMLSLSAILALASLVYSLARWDHMGAHFHPLFQFLLMGLNGAFLTGDLFNLFVFFEVLLAASYGLVLHGSGTSRVRAGLHYIAINLAGSLVFLIGAALIYGSAGTLNMADLAARLPSLAGGERTLLNAGCAILGVAFLLKAGAWPLNFWLTNAYGSAAAPVAAVFSIMTKVGVYALLRLTMLFSAAGGPAPFNGPWLFWIGLATLLFGSMAMLNEQKPQRLVSYCVIVSAGTLLAGFGIGGPTMTGATLYYLVSSVLATGAFFMLCEMIERSQSYGANVLAITMESFGVEDPVFSDRPDDVVGVIIPAAMAFLGFGFACCALLVTGMPPLSGFVAKFWMLSAALEMTPGKAPPVLSWVLLVAVLGSGLAGIIALARMGSRLFWGTQERSKPRLRVIEAGPVALLLLLSVLLALVADPAVRYLQATGEMLYAPQTYIHAVLPSASAGMPGTGGAP
ncbi:multisubunit potassium/proton antiporter PhaD subunit [Paucimonas lemoignei]|uniref:Multisubunit potassium/proton antiporter PhaD subunit n=1 Tax=Paucimonas lemoignei TaxID=29443 RepID=A0A4R3HUX1_PAULE|nr:monovalent cation/H+ antiporter subunit D [Paucimonas lemoignei]TCS36534.1 multisubunit potassium/proton antiporter PhaD subunit [Paucimonas lemoignei]